VSDTDTFLIAIGEFPGNLTYCAEQGAPISLCAPAWRWTFSIECSPVRDLRLRNATDHEIFMSAREAGAVLVSKDADFLRLLEHNPPAQVIWVTCGNTSNVRLQTLIRAAWPQVVTLLSIGEPVVELSGREDLT